MKPVRSTPPAAPRRLWASLPGRWRPWIVAGAGALAGHLIVLQAIPAARVGGTDTGARAGAPIVHLQLVSTPREEPPVRAGAAIAAARTDPVRPGRRAAAPPPAPDAEPRGAVPSADPHGSAAEPPSGPAAAVPKADAHGAPGDASAADAGESLAGTAGHAAAQAAAVAPPSYAAQLPAPFAFALGARRGEQAGSGELRFEREADGSYRLRLALHGPGRPLLEMTSAGVWGETGLAPERFTDRRPGRGVAAANLERGRGRVRFSARTEATPIAPAAQDRLSWLVHLAAIVQADAALRREGAQVLLQVVGVRGSQLWRFESAGVGEAPEAPGSPSPAMLRLVREPELPYDNRVEVWLDPARDHLPAHVRFTLVPTGHRFEFWIARP